MTTRASDPTAAQPFPARQLFWHQFKAGPWWRFFVMLPFLLIMIGGALTDSALIASVAPSVVAVVVFLLFFPESDMPKALGLTRAQAKRVLAYAAVPTALFSFLVPVLVRPSLPSLIGGALAVIITLALAANSLPNDESTHKSSVSVGAFAGSAWSSPLLWAAIVGALTGFIYPLSSHIPSEGMRQLIATFPALCFWFALVFRPELRPATAKALGITRKRWALNTLAVTVGANVLFGAVAAVIALLFDAPLQPIALTAGVGTLVCFAALVSTINAEPLTFALVWMFFFPTRYWMDVQVPDAGHEVLTAMSIMSGVVALITAVLLGLYLTGRVNTSGKSASFMGVKG